MSYIGSEATYIHRLATIFLIARGVSKYIFAIPSCHGNGVSVNGRCLEKGGALGQIQILRASERHVARASASVGAAGPDDRAKAWF